MKRVSIVCAVLAMALAGGSCTAKAETAGDFGRGGGGKKMPGDCGSAEEMHGKELFSAMAGVLRLNDAQQARIRELFKADHEEHGRINRELAENRSLLREKADAAAFDEAGARSLAQRQGELMARMIIAPAVMRHRIRALLTPDQRDLEERIQPLMALGHWPRPPLEGGEPQRGMEERRHSRNEEFHPLMGKGMPPCCEED
jgi:Spy/CpxP family protein refolding chaperone